MKLWSVARGLEVSAARNGLESAALRGPGNPNSITIRRDTHENVAMRAANLMLSPCHSFIRSKLTSRRVIVRRRIGDHISYADPSERIAAFRSIAATELNPQMVERSIDI